jgi:DNA modification methylase
MELKIKDEFKKLIPPLTPDEYKQLETNCIQEGIRDAIITWNGYIIDGHNRYKIAQDWCLVFKLEPKEFKSEQDVKVWMILNQFGRRNIGNYTRAKLALELEDIFKEKAKENLKLAAEKTNTGFQISEKALNLFNEEKPVKNIEIEKVNSVKEVAKVANLSHDTIAKVKKIEEKAAPEIKEKLSTGELSINQAYQDIKKEEKKVKFEESKQIFEKEIKVENINQIIIHGDSIEILKNYNGPKFDLLLSDPPYGMNFKSGWSDKNKIANDKIEDTIELFESVLIESVKHLKEDAHFYLFGSIDYVGHLRPIIEKYLTLKNILIWDRKIIGMGDLKSYGKSFDVIYFGINKKWKDLNGTRDKDLLSFNRCDPNKMIHPTEKPIDLLEYLIKKSTNEGDLILEPFAGGGSTLLASKNTNRLCTGIEIEKNYVDLIKTRI